MIINIGKKCLYTREKKNCTVYVFFIKKNGKLILRNCEEFSKCVFQTHNKFEKLRKQVFFSF